MNSLGSTVNKNKVGNLMVYLSKRIQPLHHTKLIKLLYFIDEYAVLDNGIPITWLSYNAWEKGPVAPETFFIKNDPENNLFSDYVTTKKQGESYKILPVQDFEKRFFSEYEIKIIDKVISDLGNKTAGELIKLSHQENSLWSQVTKRNNIDFSHSKISNYPIELSELVRGDEDKFLNYQEAEDLISFSAYSLGNHSGSCSK